MIDWGTDYGIDLSTDGARRWQRAIRPRADRPRDPREYAVWCLRVARRTGLALWEHPYRIPEGPHAGKVYPVTIADNARWAILLAGWCRIPPSEWRPGGRGEAWLTYYVHAQGEPGRGLGSPYNQAPEGLARAWSLGLPATHPAVRLCHLLPQRWRGGRRRIEAVTRLALRLRGLRGGEARSVLPVDLRTADLRRLSRMSGACLRGMDCVRTYVPLPRLGRGIDWTAMACAARLFAAVDRDRLRSERVPARLWRDSIPSGVSVPRPAPPGIDTLGTASTLERARRASVAWRPLDLREPAAWTPDLDEYDPAVARMRLVVAEVCCD